MRCTTRSVSVSRMVRHGEGGRQSSSARARAANSSARAAGRSPARRVSARNGRSALPFVVAGAGQDLPQRAGPGTGGAWSSRRISGNVSFCCSRSVPSDLPVVPLLADQVEQVVGDLEGHAQRRGRSGPGCSTTSAAAAAEDGAQPAAAGDQLGRLAVDDVEVLLLAQVQVAALQPLAQLALADAVGRLADQPAGAASPRVLAR